VYELSLLLYVESSSTVCRWPLSVISASRQSVYPLCANILGKCKAFLGAHPSPLGLGQISLLGCRLEISKSRSLVNFGYSVVTIVRYGIVPPALMSLEIGLFQPHDNPSASTQHVSSLPPSHTTPPLTSKQQPAHRLDSRIMLNTTSLNTPPPLSNGQSTPSTFLFYLADRQSMNAIYAWTSRPRLRPW